MIVPNVVHADSEMSQCVPISKTSLGGLALVGNLQGLFVALNGPAPEGVGSEISMVK